MSETFADGRSFERTIIRMENIDGFMEYFLFYYYLWQCRMVKVS